MPYPDLTHPTIAEQDARAARAARAKKHRVFTGPKSGQDWLDYQDELAARNSRIVRDYQRGTERRDLCYAYDLSDSHIYKILVEAGCNPTLRSNQKKDFVPRGEPIAGSDSAYRSDMARANQAFLKRLFREHIRTGTIPPRMDRADFLDRCRAMDIPTRSTPSAQAPAQAAAA